MSTITPSQFINTGPDAEKLPPSSNRKRVLALIWTCFERIVKITFQLRAGVAPCLLKLLSPVSSHYLHRSGFPYDEQVV